MGKPIKSKKLGKAPVSDGLDPIDPAVVYFTHSKIRPAFSGCGRRIQDTVDEILTGIKTVSELPFITVLTSGDGHYYSLNNRRLYVLKHLRSIGFLEPTNTVRVRLKTPLPREVKKYSPENCSLTATIMKGRPVKELTSGQPESDIEDDYVAVGEKDSTEESTGLVQESHPLSVSLDSSSIKQENLNTYITESVAFSAVVGEEPSRGERCLSGVS